MNIKQVALGVIVSTVILVGGISIGAAANNRWENVQRQKQAETVARQAQEAKARTEQERKYNELLAADETRRIECEKGAAAYAQLIKVAKPDAPQPNCGPAVVQ